MNSLDKIATLLRGHRFDDSSIDDAVFCHEDADSPMVGLRCGANAQSDWEEWVEHITPVIADALDLRCGERVTDQDGTIHICQSRVGHEQKHYCACHYQWVDGEFGDAS